MTYILKFNPTDKRIALTVNENGEAESAEQAGYKLFKKCRSDFRTAFFYVKNYKSHFYYMSISV